MNKNINLRKIGKVKSSHGIRGELFVIVFSKDASWISKETVFYISDKPYQLAKVKPHKDGVIVTINGVSTRNDSDLLQGQLVFVDEAEFVSQDQESLYLVEIENFQVIDEKLKNIGLITGFSSNGVQDLLVVTKGQETFEIPFVKEFIQSIDHENRILKTRLPEGLLEINRESHED